MKLFKEGLEAERKPLVIGNLPTCAPAGSIELLGNHIGEGVICRKEVGRRTQESLLLWGLSPGEVSIRKGTRSREGGGEDLGTIREKKTRNKPVRKGLKKPSRSVDSLSRFLCDGDRQNGSRRV